MQRDLFAVAEPVSPAVSGPLRVLFVLQNPSRASATVEDATLRKGIGFCRRWGGRWSEGDHDPIVASGARHSECGRYRYTLTRAPSSRRWSLTFVNLCAWRATFSADLVQRAAEGVDVIGPENDGVILEEAKRADRIVVAWGAAVSYGPRMPPALRGRDQHVLELLRGRELWCLGRANNGAPRHPRMLAYDTPLDRFTGGPS